MAACGSTPTDVQAGGHQPVCHAAIHVTRPRKGDDGLRLLVVVIIRRHVGRQRSADKVECLAYGNESLAWEVESWTSYGLEVFREVRPARFFNSGGERLALHTNTAVYRQIAAMEQDPRTTLFDLGPARVRSTDEGRCMLDTRRRS